MSSPDPELERQLAAVATVLEDETPSIDGPGIRSQFEPARRPGLAVRGRFLVATAAVIAVVVGLGIGLQAVVPEGLVSEPGADSSTENSTLPPRTTVLTTTTPTTDGTQPPTTGGQPLVTGSQPPTTEADPIAEGTGLEGETVSLSSTTTRSIVTPRAAEDVVAPSVYEPFAAGSGSVLDSGGGVGFAEAAWMPQGSITVSDVPGLTYRDASGAELIVGADAVRVASTAGVSHLRRTLASPLAAADGYYVSFLLQLDSETFAGDAFWTPDGVFDRNGVGFQSRDWLQFVNGPASPALIEVGRVHLVVVRIDDSGGALWVDPVLGGQPQPLVTNPTETETADEMIFTFNSDYGAAYVLDEIRAGPTFASVTPHQSGS